MVPPVPMLRKNQLHLILQNFSKNTIVQYNLFDKFSAFHSFYKFLQKKGILSAIAQEFQNKFPVAGNFCVRFLVRMKVMLFQPARHIVRFANIELIAFMAVNNVEIVHINVYKISLSVA